MYHLFVNFHCLNWKKDRNETVEGSGQNLERRYRLEIWRETHNWMQSRCNDLVELDRERDAASLALEFRLKGIAWLEISSMIQQQEGKLPPRGRLRFLWQPSEVQWRVPWSVAVFVDGREVAGSHQGEHNSSRQHDSDAHHGQDCCGVIAHVVASSCKYVTRM